MSLWRFGQFVIKYYGINHFWKKSFLIENKKILHGDTGDVRIEENESY